MQPQTGTRALAPGRRATIGPSCRQLKGGHRRTGRHRGPCREQPSCRIRLQGTPDSVRSSECLRGSMTENVFENSEAITRRAAQSQNILFCTPPPCWMHCPERRNNVQSDLSAHKNKVLKHSFKRESSIACSCLAAIKTNTLALSRGKGALKYNKSVNDHWEHIGVKDSLRPRSSHVRHKGKFSS